MSLKSFHSGSPAKILWQFMRLPCFCIPTNSITLDLFTLVTHAESTNCEARHAAASQPTRCPLFHIRIVPLAPCSSKFNRVLVCAIEFHAHTKQT